MKKLLFCLALMSLPLIGCDNLPGQLGIKGDRPSYVKDERTGLCFAVAYYKLAHVPCTEKVEELINNKMKKECHE